MIPRKEKKVDQHVRKNLEDIMKTMKCPKGFVCYTSGFRKLCRAKDVGLDSFVACMVSVPMECKFSIHFGGLFFCQCPLRVCISKNLKK